MEKFEQERESFDLRENPERQLVELQASGRVIKELVFTYENRSLQPHVVTWVYVVADKVEYFMTRADYAI